VKGNLVAVITGTLPPSPGGLWTPPFVADVSKSNARYLSVSAYDLNVRREGGRERLWTPSSVADVSKRNARYLSLSAYDLSVRREGGRERGRSYQLNYLLLKDLLNYVFGSDVLPLSLPPSFPPSLPS